MIYTTGYTGVQVDRLAQFLEAQDTLLADIRFAPMSRNPVYTEAQLAARFQERYFHLYALGNRNYRGGPIDIVDYERGLYTLEGLLQRWPAALLLCVCRTVETCHRKDVGERLSVDLALPLQ